MPEEELHTPEGAALGECTSSDYQERVDTCKFVAPAITLSAEMLSLFCRQSHLNQQVVNRVGLLSSFCPLVDRLDNSD